MSVKEYIALCSSFKCTGEHILNHSKEVEKDIKSGNTCPDCGYGIRWVKSTNYRRTLRAARGRKPKVYDINSPD